jgi:hypothetical protein
MNLAQVKEAVASQCGAALDMLENAVRACPDPHWADGSVIVDKQFWYLVFHTLWWHDHYVSPTEASHRPPAPYTMDEMSPDYVYPPTTYTRGQLLAFLEHGRRRCRERNAGLTDESAAAPCGFERRNMSVLELLLYNLRHVQHHTAQLNLLLRQRIDSAPRWVSRGANP